MLTGGPSWTDDHDDYYPRSRRAVAQRVASVRCVGCDAWTVDAYYCCECAIRSDYCRRIDDRASSTASTVSRLTQLRVDQAAAYEQLIQLQTANDPNTATLDDDTESARSAKIRKMSIASNGHCGLSRDESARVERMFPAVLHSGGRNVTYASATIRREKRIERKQRAAAVTMAAAP